MQNIRRNLLSLSSASVIKCFPAASPPPPPPPTSTLHSRLWTWASELQIYTVAQRNLAAHRRRWTTNKTAQHLRRRPGLRHASSGAPSSAFPAQKSVDNKLFGSWNTFQNCPLMTSSWVKLVTKAFRKIFWSVLLVLTHYSQLRQRVFSTRLQRVRSFCLFSLKHNAEMFSLLWLECA